MKLLMSFLKIQVADLEQCDCIVFLSISVEKEETE